MASPETPQVKEYLDETGLAYYHEKNTTAVKKEIKALGDKFEGELFTFENSLQIVENQAGVNSSRIEAIQSTKADKKQVTREALVDTIGIFNTESAGLAPMANESNTIDVFQGATADSDGTTGLVPAPTALGDSAQTAGSSGTKIYFGTATNAGNDCYTVTLVDADGFELKENTLVFITFPDGLDCRSSDYAFNVAGSGYVVTGDGKSPSGTTGLERICSVCPVNVPYLFIYSNNHWYGCGYSVQSSESKGHPGAC